LTSNISITEIASIASPMDIMSVDILLATFTKNSMVRLLEHILFIEFLPLGSPLVLFFHGIDISFISQNNFMALTKLWIVAPVISFLSTLSFYACRKLRMLLSNHLLLLLLSLLPFLLSIYTALLHLSSMF
jgi:hypothetical protein